MSQLCGESSGCSTALSHDDGDVALRSKHRIFLSHSGSQKDFVEQLCVDLERCDRYPFFDRRRDSLPIGENFPQHIFGAIRQCHVGVVILSEEFFTRSRWPMTELAAMVKEAKQRSWSFKIVPVFLSISLDQFDNETKRDEWVSCWKEFALKDERVEVEQWRDALKFLRPVNSLVYDGLGEVKFRKVIVEELCKLVRAETRLEDSHIQGRSRMCKLIQNEINAQEKGENQKVRVVGLYGMGGMGKTSICKALCNEFCSEFQGRVCHAELERGSKEELMREVLKRVTDASHELIIGWSLDEVCSSYTRRGVDCNRLHLMNVLGTVVEAWNGWLQLLNKLNGGIMKEAVFLAVDNVSDTQASVDEARSYLAARLPAGSVVVVTARGRGTLMRVRPYVTESNVLGMPELDVEEAKSLFAASSNLERRSEADEELVVRCVERCHFAKDDGSGSKQYHPLTLDVLGKQLGCVERREWKAELDKIDADIFNRTCDAEHPIFSILRKSYDTLSREDQLLFVDVALDFFPNYRGFPYRGSLYIACGPNMLEWLGAVHGVSADGVMEWLERLERKSLLERLVDGSEVQIGVHDLWRAFCKAEVECGEARGRRWVYGAKGRELVKTNPSGGCWENVTRMDLGGGEWSHTLERVKFAHFSNVTVLKMVGLEIGEEGVLDLSGLIQLKSLEVEGSGLHQLDLRGLARCLLYMRWSSNGCPSRSRSLQFVEEVAFLTELQYLVLRNYSGGELPDLSRLTSLRVAVFFGCENVKSLSGLSSKLSKLRLLDVGLCRQLRRCRGVGDLVTLEVLDCRLCKMLGRLPDVGRLGYLRSLNVFGCPVMRDIPGLGGLGALEELRAGSNFEYIFHLRDMHKVSKLEAVAGLDLRKLSKLRVLDLQWRRFEALAGLESLVSLQELVADFREVAERPSLRQLTQLQRLDIRGWSLERLGDLGNLAMLRQLTISYCTGVDKLPDFGRLVNLQYLGICDCDFSDMSRVSGLSALQSLSIKFCEKLERLPDLAGLPRLYSLHIEFCPMLRSWNRAVEGAVEGSPCRWDKTNEVSELSCSGSVTVLRNLTVWDCRNLEDVMGIGAFSQLESLECWSIPVKELPDLSKLPRLKSLALWSCRSLRSLKSGEPIHALSELNVSYCSRLTALSDLSTYFPGLEVFQLLRCEGITTLSSAGPLAALRSLTVDGCVGLNALPDLGMFPALQTLSLEGCSRLTRLSSSMPLPALKSLYTRGCNSLSEDDVEQLRALCPQCEIKCGAVPVAVESGGSCSVLLFLWLKLKSIWLGQRDLNWTVQGGGGG